MNKPHSQIFADHAWIGPGQFADRVLITFTDLISEVSVIPPDQPAPASARHVKWLTPGFINAHCHLEYSFLAGKLPRGPLPFGHWMRAILDLRALENLPPKDAAMKSAADQLIRGGCTMVWDSSTDGSSQQIFDQSHIWNFLFHEVLGLTPQRAQLFLDTALAHIHQKPAGAYHLGDGLNPHAPYSVGPWLRGQLRLLPRNLMQAWHLGETPDENELFLSGSGSIAEFYRETGLPFPYETLPRTTSTQFLQGEDLLRGCAIAYHANQLTPSELSFFAAPSAVVHCPLTHEWFQRPPVALDQWIKAGANVCIGTDSLASSRSLSMLDALCEVASHHPRLTTDDILTMACFNPLQCNIVPHYQFTGTITPGGSADFVALSSAPGTNWQNIFQSQALQVQQCWTSGTARIPAG